MIANKLRDDINKIAVMRRKMVTVSFFTSLFFSVFLAFVLEYIEKRKHLTGKDKEKAQIFKDYLSFKRKV